MKKTSLLSSSSIDWFCNCAGEDPLALTVRFIAEFHKDMDALGCLRPSREPKATEHVEDMVATITTIIDNGHAYAVDGDVFFDVESLPGYGRLSGQTLDGSVAGELWYSFPSNSENIFV